MKQYCRYCTNCVYGDCVYCSELRKIMSESSAKTVNNCKHFIFNEIDVFDFNKVYKPRKAKQEDKQLSLF